MNRRLFFMGGMGAVARPRVLLTAAELWPNHVWSTDITYIPMRGGFLYLVALMDWFSRYVLS